MTKDEEKALEVYKCDNCLSTWNGLEVKTVTKNGSNCCDFERETYCPKCESRIFKEFK